MTGLKLIEERSLKERLDFEELHSKYTIVLPPIFRLFLETYKWNSKLTMNKSFYYYPELAGGEISFPFNNIDENIASTIGSSDDEIIDRKLILIAQSRFGYYIGTINDDKDKVFTKTTSLEGSFKVVANNVFEFLRGVTDNLSEVAESVEEYSGFMKDLGYEEDEIEVAAEKAEKKLKYYKKMGKYDEYQMKQKVTAFLINRGFSFDVAKKTVQKIT